MVPPKVVIPVKARFSARGGPAPGGRVATTGIQFFQDLLDAPVSRTGQAPQVRHDGKREFINRLQLIENIKKFEMLK